jgi:hypothetical protein
MLQYSKVVKSRDEWKNKAVQRAGKVSDYGQRNKRAM